MRIISVILVLAAALQTHAALGAESARSRRDGLQLAQNNKRQGGSLTQQKAIKMKSGAKAQTEVDFDESLIEGQVRNPFGSLIGRRDPDMDGGFVRIRRKWHDMMVMSASSLSP